MIQTELLTIGNGKAQGILINEPGGEGHPNMIVITCDKGYLMCGYLKLEAAERFGDAAVLVGGADFKGVLQNPIKGMTSAAAELGVKEGMTGEDAALILIQ